MACAHDCLTGRHAHLPGTAQIPQLHSGNSAAQVTRNNAATGQDGQVFQHHLAPVSVLGRVNRGNTCAALVAPRQQAHDASRSHLVSNDQQGAFGVSHQRDQNGHFFGGLQALVRHQNVGVVEHHLHFFDVSHHVVRQVAALKGHAIHHFQQGLHGCAVVNIHNAVCAHPLQCLGHESPGHFVIGRNNSNGAQLIAATQRLGSTLKRCNRFGNGQFQPFHQFNRIGPACQTRQPVLHQRIGQYSSGGGAITGHVVSLFGYFTHNLCAHVFKRIFKLNFCRNTDAVAGNNRRADRPVNDGVHPTRA